MAYRFELVDRDYTHFSSGRVFYGVPGVPALPVRLVSEVFLRCKALLNAPPGAPHQLGVYDPCCGAAYHLIALAYLHWADIHTILASDIDPLALEGARRNLSLLTLAGLERRIQELQTLYQQYGKPSHADAIQSALLLREILTTYLRCHGIRAEVSQSDSLAAPTPPASIKDHPIDLILTDIPYGQHSAWKSSSGERIENPLESLLEAMAPYLSPNGLIAIIADKAQKVAHPRYQRLQKINFGKRQAVILKIIGD